MAVRPTVVAATLLAPLTLLATAGAGAAPVPGSAARPIVAKADPSRGFAPARVVARPGAFVFFRNADRLQHNAVSDKRVRGRRVFRAGRPGTGAPTTGNWKLKAPTALGSYGYFCEVHAFMTGTLVVRR